MLKILFKIPLVPTLFRTAFHLKNPKLERKLFGLNFPNPVGLAAGFDKDAKLIDEMAGLGFGFIEIGTLTPKPQKGNSKPRLFRLIQDQALINRMGFNNLGVLPAVKRLRNHRSDIIIGGNIGINKDTPLTKAVEDYEYCFEALYEVVDYFVINVSSPNTPHLRDLQAKEPLQRLLSRIRDRSREKGKTKPVLLKIAPDLDEVQLDDIIEIVHDLRIDGLIATNTTTDRKQLNTTEEKINEIGPGGLSGKPLAQKSTEIIRYLHNKLPDKPIIGVGGIMTVDDAIEKINAGASLIQLYTGFVYNGPSLIRKINKKLIELHLEKTVQP